MSVLTACRESRFMQKQMGRAGRVVDSGGANQCIHIGIPKTATTWLQKEIFTLENYFLPIGRFGPGGDKCQSDQLSDFIRHSIFEPECLWRRKKKSIQREIYTWQKKAVKNKKKLVISNEHFSMPTIHGSDLPVVFNRLKTLFGDAEIAISVRNQKSFFKSFYSQLVVNKGASLSFSEFMYINRYIDNHYLNIAHALDYEFLLEVASDHFSSVNVVAYEDFKNAPAQNVDKLLGVEIDPDVFPETHITNAQRDEETLCWARSLNKLSAHNIGSKVEQARLNIHSPMFRKIKLAIQNKKVSLEDVKTFNAVVGARKQQMLMMHDKANLKEVCELLRLEPEPANTYELDNAWFESEYGPANRALAEKYNIDLKALNYPMD